MKQNMSFSSLKTKWEIINNEPFTVKYTCDGHEKIVEYEVMLLRKELDAAAQSIMFHASNKTEPKNKIILIDDMYAKGWDIVFETMINQIYGTLVHFEALHDISDAGIRACYEANPNALFIQDNELGEGVKPGIDWVNEYGRTRCIVMHSADHRKAFDAAQAGAVMFMHKDNPGNQMTAKEMQDMIIEFHKNVIKHFKLIPELIWLVYHKMNINS